MSESSKRNKKKVKSRWIKNSGIPRYTKPQETVNDSYHEQPGWFHGAKVFKK